MEMGSSAAKQAGLGLEFTVVPDFWASVLFFILRWRHSQVSQTFVPRQRQVPLAPKQLRDKKC